MYTIFYFNNTVAEDFLNWLKQNFNLVKTEL